MQLTAAYCCLLYTVCCLLPTTPAERPSDDADNRCFSRCRRNTYGHARTASSDVFRCGSLNRTGDSTGVIGVKISSLTLCKRWDLGWRALARSSHETFQVVLVLNQA